MDKFYICVFFLWIFCSGLLSERPRARHILVQDHIPTTTTAARERTITSGTEAGAIESQPQVPVEQGNDPEAPVEQGNDPEAPVEQGNDPETTVEQGNDPEIPVEQGNDPEAPVEQGNDPEAPVEQGNEPRSQSTRTISANRQYGTLEQTGTGSSGVGNGQYGDPEQRQTHTDWYRRRQRLPARNTNTQTSHRIIVNQGSTGHGSQTNARAQAFERNARGNYDNTGNTYSANGNQGNSRPSVNNRQSPFFNRMSAFDFLASRGSANILQTAQMRRNRELNRIMSEGMCEAFNKHFVATSIGGKCV